MESISPFFQRQWTRTLQLLSFTNWKKSLDVARTDVDSGTDQHAATPIDHAILRSVNQEVEDELCACCFGGLEPFNDCLGGTDARVAAKVAQATAIIRECDHRPWWLVLEDERMDASTATKACVLVAQAALSRDIETMKQLVSELTTLDQRAMSQATRSNLKCLQGYVCFRDGSVAAWEATKAFEEALVLNPQNAFAIEGSMRAKLLAANPTLRCPSDPPIGRRIQEEMGDASTCCPRCQHAYGVVMRRRRWCANCPAVACSACLEAGSARGHDKPAPVCPDCSVMKMIENSTWGRPQPRRTMHCGYVTPDQNFEFYNGEWTNGYWDGQGEHENSRGDVYRGAFRMGKRHGAGTMHFADGSYYSGTWDDDAFDEGLYLSNGQAFKGKWRGEVATRCAAWNAQQDLRDLALASLELLLPEPPRKGDAHPVVLPCCGALLCTCCAINLLRNCLTTIQLTGAPVVRHDAMFDGGPSCEMGVACLLAATRHTTLAGLTERMSLTLTDGFQPCPFPECCGGALKDDVCHTGLFVCSLNPEHQSCSLCGQSWKAGHNCTEDPLIELVRKRVLAQCPRCFFIQERSGACRALRCARCKGDFCTFCDAKLQSHRGAHGAHIVSCKPKPIPSWCPHCGVIQTTGHTCAARR